MPKFTNINDLMNYIKKTTSENLEVTVGKKVFDTLKEYTNELLYESQTPKSYDRTYDLLNSITISEVKNVGGEKFQIEVFFDSKKIIPRETEGNNWNQHMSTDGFNTNESANIPFYMEYGHGGLYDQEDLHFTQDTYNYLNETGGHITELQRRLKMIGIDCKFI